jgi:phytoene dehydrogenase-like protein
MVKKKIFDYLVLGSGLGGLSIAALLAKSGKSVCLIEGYKGPGGYASNLQLGPYSFTHGPKYLFGCFQKGPVIKFLKKVGLDKKIKFNPLDKKCFDHISLPTGKIKVPLGADNYKEDLIEHFPSHKEGLEEYFEILKTIFNEADIFDHIPETMDFVLHPIKHRHIWLYKKKKLQELFKELKFPMELRAILAGQAGNIAMCPEDAPVLAHAGMIMLYERSAHHPKRGIKHLTSQITNVIAKKSNCKIIYNNWVEEICLNKSQSSVKTSKGKKIFGKTIISNIDPHETIKLIKDRKFPAFEKSLRYKYSDSLFQVFLGLKNIDLKKYGFGRWNTWHHEYLDLSKEYKNIIKNNNFKHPWLFITTPSLFTDKEKIAPKNGACMEILTFVNYKYFKKIFDTDRKKYNKIKKDITKTFIDIVEKNYLPDIRKHIDVMEVWTPIDIVKNFRIVEGNVYGSRLDTVNVSINKIDQNTPAKNLFFVGATSSMPGVMGVIEGSLSLYEDLIHEK